MWLGMFTMCLSKARNGHHMCSSTSNLVRIPDPWNSSLEFGLEFQGSGVATALEQHMENSIAIPPYTIKVWCQFLQNITSMLFFFQMNGVSVSQPTYLFGRTHESPIFVEVSCIFMV